MEEACSLLHVPAPLPDGCTGACFGHPEADDWRASDPERYVDWVVSLRESDARAPVASAWALEDGVVWATGLPFEQACALLRRALLSLASVTCTAEEALRARDDVRAAGRLAEESPNEIFGCAAPLCELGSLASLANACVHAKLLPHAAPAFHAGLWRSVARALERDPLEEATSVRRAIGALRAHAHCEALRQSAQACFDAGQAAAARACAKRALDVARHQAANDPQAVRAGRVRSLEREYEAFDTLCARLGCGARVFDSSLMCEAVPLPDV